MRLLALLVLTTGLLVQTAHQAVAAPDTISAAAGHGRTGTERSVVSMPGDTERPTRTNARAIDDHVAFGTYRNVFPNDLSSVVAYERAIGKRMTIIHWYALWGGWKSAFNRSDLEVIDRRGSVPMISWEPWNGVPNDPAWSLREAILSGRHDAYIESWARGMAAYGKPVLLRFAHEMHDNYDYPWVLDKLGNTAPEYVAAWQHVHDIFERNGATNVAWVWSPNTLGDSPSWIHERVYRSLYPGDAYVDWVGLNIYNTGPRVNWLAPTWRSLSTALAEPYVAITTLTDKPLVLGEVASAEIGGDKAEWISDALGPSLVAQFPRVKAVIWFDVDKEEAWTVESSNRSYSAFIDALRQAHFMQSRADLGTAIQP